MSELNCKAKIFILSRLFCSVPEPYFEPTQLFTIELLCKNN